jgi:hypothetical protein
VVPRQVELTAGMEYFVLSFTWSESERLKGREEIERALPTFLARVYTATSFFGVKITSAVSKQDLVTKKPKCCFIVMVNKVLFNNVF